MDACAIVRYAQVAQKNIRAVSLLSALGVQSDLFWEAEVVAHTLNAVCSHSRPALPWVVRAHRLKTYEI